jgi:hypothetical protein
MNDGAVTPPNEGWHVYRVNVVQHEVGTIDVLAPSADAAKGRVRRYIAEDEDGLQEVAWEHDAEMWAEPGEDTPEDLGAMSTEAAAEGRMGIPDIEYDPGRDASTPATPGGLKS